MADDPDSELKPDEIARRRDDALRRALNTPPKAHEPMGKRKSKSREKEAKPGK